MSPRVRAALITRAHTRNQGNALLSTVWRDALAQRFDECTVFERVPAFLKQFTLDRLRREADRRGGILPAFDAWAIDLAQLARDAGPPPPSAPISLDASAPRALPMARLRERLALGGLAARIGRGRDAYAARMASIARHDLVVVNGAGEFMASSIDTPLRYLLELRAAQIAGCRTAFVNTTIDIVEPSILSVLAHVLDRADHVAVRDEHSFRRLSIAGAYMGAVRVMPDAAMFYRKPVAPPRPTPSAIGLCLSAQAGGDDANVALWGALAGRLKAAWLNPELISNEWHTDAAVMARVADRHRLITVGPGLSIDAYIAALGQYQVVVTARLHTAVMAMLAGVPVVAIERDMPKISGLFDQLGMAHVLDDCVIRSPSTADQIVRRIADRRRYREQTARWQFDAIEHARPQFDAALDAMRAAIPAAANQERIGA